MKLIKVKNERKIEKDRGKEIKKKKFTSLSIKHILLLLLKEWENEYYKIHNILNTKKKI